MRKVLAVIFTLVTLFAIKECVYIFTTTDADVVSQRPQLILTAISLTLPLFIFTLWLWMPKRKNTDGQSLPQE